MAKGLLTIANELKADGKFAQVMRNPLAQLGTLSQLNLNQTMLGARYLPEETRRKNEYKEKSVRYRTTIATDGTPYSRPQRTGTALVGDMSVVLGHHDILTELNAQEIEAIEDLIATNEETRGAARAEIMAQQQLLNWIDFSVNASLKIKQEKQRWDAIVSASVTRAFPNGTSESVSFPNPAGHRFNAGGTWSSDAYDPFDDIVAGCNLLWGKGFNIDAMITSTPVVSTMALNEKVRTRASYLSMSGGSVIANSIAGYGLADVNAAVRRSSSSTQTLPEIQTYDLQYPTQTGTAYFLPRNCFVIIGSTGEQREILVEERIFPLYNTLGYYAIGRVEGYKNTGPIVQVETFDKKPVRIEAEGYVTGFPVITNPEAIVVIQGIS
jgi:hypothetical protein